VWTWIDLPLEKGPPMNRVVEVQREELLRRREALAQRVGMTYEVLAKKARDEELPADEWWVWQDIQALNYLLGERAESFRRA
jgi:hypothetical protein